jgi:hypothetical protein
MLKGIEDLAVVRALVNLHIEGANGNAAMLEEAFHPQARMAGNAGGFVHDNVPIGEFISFVAENPGMAGTNYATDVRLVDLRGDAGVAVLVEYDRMDCDFVDYFSVARENDRWWITDKTYACTRFGPPTTD